MARRRAQAHSEARHRPDNRNRPGLLVSLWFWRTADEAAENEKLAAVTQAIELPYSSDDSFELRQLGLLLAQLIKRSQAVFPEG